MTMEPENQENQDQEVLIPDTTIVTHCIYKDDLKRLIKSFEDETDPYKPDMAELINERDDDGKSPLDLAASFGRTDICRELINQGADITSISEKGYSPMHYAAAWGHIEILKVLVNANANLQQQNVHGERPRDTAARYNQTECVNFLDWAEAKMALAQFIKSCQESISDPEKSGSRLSKDEKHLVMASCKEKTEWLENAVNPSTQEFVNQRQALRTIVSPVLQKVL